MADETLERSLLYDFYGELLTEKQRDAFDLYYNDDLSLAEIADLWDCSRQNVRDAVKKAESVMAEYEEKTGLVARHRKLNRELEIIGSKLETLAGEMPDSQKALFEDIRRDIERLKDGI